VVSYYTVFPAIHGILLVRVLWFVVLEGLSEKEKNSAKWGKVGL